MANFERTLAEKLVAEEISLPKDADQDGLRSVTVQITNGEYVEIINELMRIEAKNQRIVDAAASASAVLTKVDALKAEYEPEKVLAAKLPKIQV